MDTPPSANVLARFQFASYSFIVAGLITIIITSMTFTDGSVIGNIAGYSAVLGGVLVMGAITVNSKIKNSGGGSGSSGWKSIITTVVPIFLLVSTLVFNITTTSIYFKSIVKESIPYYGTFSFVTVLLLCVQLYLLFLAQGSNGQLNMRLASLMGIMNLLTATTIFIILKYYPTDC